MINIQIRPEAGTDPNAEGGRQNGERERPPTVAEVPDWWAAVPEGEKTLLHTIARMLRSAKLSELQDVARAAVKWERGIGYFVKVRLIWEHRKAAPGKAEIGKAESRN
jgi:hypothetical protein